ncbi:MAG: hypothetical protein IH868_08890 [Chloroflexi bacterium]|nr:hypothetical protein [Chloroflexota bacterium]
MTSKNFTGTFAHFSTRRNWAVPSWVVVLVAIPNSFRESWVAGRREADQVAYRAICR